jgi:hypothetical protein
MKNGLEKLHNLTLIHLRLMHRITHAHLINAKSLDRPECIIDQMTASSLSATLVKFRGWPRDHFLGLWMPCHNGSTPSILSCNLIFYSLTMSRCGACWGMSRA